MERMLTKTRSVLLLAVLGVLMTSCGQVQTNLSDDMATQAISAEPQQNSTGGSTTVDEAPEEPAVVPENINELLDARLPEEDQPMHSSY